MGQIRLYGQDKKALWYNRFMEDKNSDVVGDFVSRENKSYRFRLGKILASSLSGFIAGFIFASILWFLAAYVFKLGI